MSVTVLLLTLLRGLAVEGLKGCHCSFLLQQWHNLIDGLVGT